MARVNVELSNGCNPIQKVFAERAKKRATGRIVGAVAYLFAGLVVKVNVDGDPRGFSVKLVGLPISNELGGDWGLA